VAEARCSALPRAGRPFVDGFAYVVAQSVWIEFPSDRNPAQADERVSAGPSAEETQQIA